jgi:TRAP-type C4-dicarboxylate transport system substrate-binding protein
MKWGVAAVAAALCFTSTAGTADEIKLTFATNAGPNRSPHPEVSLPWAERINEAGKGLVNVNVVQGFTIVTPQTFYARVQNDVVQIVYGLQGSVGGVFRLSDVVRVPYLVEKGDLGSVAFWRLYKTGLLDADYKDVHPLALGMYPQSAMHLAKQPKSILDLSGLKIVANSKVTGDIIEKLGGTPITILIQETYEALQRRTVDGTITGYPAIIAFKFNEVAPVHVDAQLGGGATMLVMAKKKWQELPEALQRLLDENSGEALSRRYGAANDAEWVEAQDFAKAQKNTIIIPTAEQDAAFRRKLEPVADNWVKDNPNGAAVLSKFRELMAQARAETGKK